jgi:hypothetical protein
MTQPAGFPFDQNSTDACPAFLKPFAAMAQLSPWSPSEWDAGFQCGVADPFKMDWLINMMTQHMMCLQNEVKELRAAINAQNGLVGDP